MGGALQNGINLLQTVVAVTKRGIYQKMGHKLDN